MENYKELSIEDLASATITFHGLLTRYLKISQEKISKNSIFLANMKDRLKKIEESVLLIGSKDKDTYNKNYNREELVSLSELLLLLEECLYYIDCLEKGLLIFFTIKFETFPPNYKELNFIINDAGFCTYYSPGSIVSYSNKANARECGDIRKQLYFDVDSREIRTI